MTKLSDFRKEVRSKQLLLIHADQHGFDERKLHKKVWLIASGWRDNWVADSPSFVSLDKLIIWFNKTYKK